MWQQNLYKDSATALRSLESILALEDFLHEVESSVRPLRAPDVFAHDARREIDLR
jgi:hypothetical protein